PPDQEMEYLVNPTGSRLGQAFLWLDRVLKWAEPVVFDGWLKARRQKAIRRAVAFITERLNGVEGLGGIFPAMANTVMAFDALGYSPDHPDRKTATEAVR